ncbi:MAG: heparinase II/III family protein [Clostridia bacterium]
MKIFEVKKEILKGNSSYTKMLNEMREETENFCKNFHDSPDYLSEWGHNYFCPVDGERLIFDLNKPHHHECQLCHTVYQNKTFDNVWTYFYRNQAILTLMKLAVLYKMDKNPKDLENYKKILGFYADNYTKFALHVKGEIMDDLTHDVGGAGRIMPQGLNEAIVAIRIIISLEILGDDLDKGFVNGLTAKLFNPMTQILIPQLIRIHNIPCWLNSAVGVIGLFTKNQELIDLVFKGEFGINEQLKQGVTADKFWYEGSIHYNFFLLEGVTYLMAFSEIYGQKFDSKGIVEQMLIQAYNYAFDNDILPNPNDGWPNVTLKSYEYIYCLATKVFGVNSEVGNIYKHIIANQRKRVEFPLSKPYYYNDISFERLVCLPDIDIMDRKDTVKTSKCFENSYFAMLKNIDINLFMKYGHRGPSHAHPDKMNIEIMLFGQSLSRDLSNTGYASKLCNEWHRQSLSHNTVVVDGENHVSTDGGTVLNYNSTNCKAMVKDVYEGVDFQRDVAINADGFTDCFNVSSKSIHNYDWIFHSEAELATDLNLEDANILFDKNGYEHLKAVKKVKTECDTLKIKWKLGKINLESIFDVKDKEVFVADTYDNPVSKYRKAIILRQKTNNAEFNVIWNVTK